MERFGVPPSKVVEVQALAGDSIDNVPGVRGIGVKTAAELINTFGDLESLLSRLNEIKQPKRRETLIENAENARISLRLVKLDDRVPLKIQLDEFAVQDPEPVALIGFLKAMEFSALSQARGIAFRHRRCRCRSARRRSGAACARRTRRNARRCSAVAPVPPEKALLPSDAGRAGRQTRRGHGQAALFKPIDHAKYETVITLERLHHWIARAREDGQVCVDTQSTSHRCDAGETVRCFARGRAWRGLLHPLRPSLPAKVSILPVADRSRN